LHWLWWKFGVGWISENHSRLHWNYVYNVMLKIILHYVELIEIIVLIVFENFVTKKYTCEKRPIRKEWTIRIKQNKNAKKQKEKHMEMKRWDFIKEDWLATQLLRHG